MEIEVKKSYGHYLLVKADNVNIEEDIEDRIYSKTEDGKTDYKKPPLRDISDESLKMISSALLDMIYYREREFDSSELVLLLFEKLPESVASELSNKLRSDYFINEKE